MEDLRGDDPRVIGSYRILSRIGSGGMGMVYLAEDPTGRQVALKLVRPELADDPAFRSRFRREVQAGQRVGGICTAKYLDADLESAHPYLVTEYVEGGSLADYVATHGPLAREQLVGLAVGLAEAVVAMHASGVIHRDLKPTNVLMAVSGPKVVDFGISHAADATALTQTGVVVGSPSWMAPEQAQGRETTPAADVFSWGATVAFAATGHSPFGEGRPDAVIYRVVHEEPDLTGIDPKLLPFVSAALRKDASARPAADKLLVDVVKTAMAGDLPPGGSVAMTTLVLDRTWVKEPPAPPPPKPRRGRQVALVAASVVIIAAFVAAALYVAHGDRSKESPLTTASTSPSSGQWTNPHLVIAAQSLGAVQVGMTLDQAQAAAGLTFDGAGDGMYYPTTTPDHLYVGLLNAAPAVSCVGAAQGQSAGTQRVSTTEGFRLGESVQALLAVYGSRVRLPRNSGHGLCGVLLVGQR